MALLEVKLRPIGPWRIGHRTGDRERVETVYHSDALFSAVTHAMGSLGWMEEWLEATARANGTPAVRLGSLFPFAGNTRLVPPPRTSWPPVSSGRLYLRAASLVPLEVALGAMAQVPFDENRYVVDGESGCLIPGGASPPFHVSVRSSVAVDRVHGSASDAHRTACLEFHPRAGWWGLVDISNLQWETRVRAAFRLLADSGFGGERSRGWGRASEPEWSGATRLFPAVEAPGAWWLLSMYSPHASDAVDWSRGEYEAEARGGWTDSPAGVARKKSVRMISEGSVLAAPALRGQALDVAPDGFAHPVFRFGFALAIPVAISGLQRTEMQVVELPGVESPVSETAPEEPYVPTAIAMEAVAESLAEEAPADARPARETPVEESPVETGRTEPTEAAVPEAQRPDTPAVESGEPGRHAEPGVEEPSE